MGCKICETEHASVFNVQIKVVDSSKGNLMW